MRPLGSWAILIASEGLSLMARVVARAWGFPTINLEGIDTLIPADGVYAGPRVD